MAVAACGGVATEPEEILVSAAASLTDVFGAIEAEYEQAHPGTDVVLNFGGSSTLREQILAGAPADVFASANQANVAAVVAAGDVSGDPVVFAENLMEIAVPRGNPADVADLSAFSEERLLLGLCTEGVPCGDFARLVFERGNIAPAIDTNEPNVRALVTKIEAGELDAGIVYVTDVAASDVDGVPIPERLNAEASYPIVVLSGAPNPEGAHEFVAFVLSSVGQTILSDFGFTTP
jgi:molybdate transport system substrate-binding protein